MKQYALTRNECDSQVARSLGSKLATRIAFPATPLFHNHLRCPGVWDAKSSPESNGMALGVAEGRGEQEGAARYGEGDERAGPLVAVAGTGGHAGRVQKK